jgi:phosphoglycolate phosphatase
MKRGPVGFDLDMTLIDSRPAIMAAWSAVARETGTEVNLEAVDRRLGIKLEDELEYWFPAPDLDQAARIYRRHYVELAPRLTVALPGARDAIAAVRQAGQSVVIITAKHPISVTPSLKAVALEPDEVFSNVHGPEKAAVLKRIGATAYVGDTPPDMIAATDAGAQAVGVATGSFTRQDLLDASASLVLDSLREFPSWYVSACAALQPDFAREMTIF